MSSEMVYRTVMHTSALEAQTRISLLLSHAWTQASSNISNVTWRKRMICKVSAMTEGAACSEGWALFCCFRYIHSSSLLISLERLRNVSVSPLRLTWGSSSKLPAESRGWQ